MKKTGLSFLLAIAFALCFLPFYLGCKSTPKNTTYNITCSLENNVLQGVERVDFYNDTDNAYSELKFNLFGNAFRKDAVYKPISNQYLARAYPNGLSYGDMKIKSVKQGGKPIDFYIGGQDENVLCVKLLGEVFPNERACVEIEFTLKLANVVSRTGYTDKTINLGNFYPVLCAIDEQGFYECVYYPIGDPFYSDCADYTVEFKCDKNYVVASTGKEIFCNQHGDLATYKYIAPNVRSFSLVLSKQFKCEQASVNNTTIKYYYYNDQNPEQNLEYAVKSLRLFNGLFGEYPYEQYSVVQTEFLQGGMEYPSLVMISDSLEPESFGEVIVHETAHQWWQTVVGNNEIKYGFLDEGLAEYSVVLFYENHPEYNLKREDMIRSAETTYKVFCSVQDKLLGGVNTVMNRSLFEFKSEYEYVNMAYLKPCIMYEYLRKTVGDQNFFKSLKRYYKEYSFLNATPDELVGVFEKIGTNANGFFYSFFDGKVVI